MRHEGDRRAIVRTGGGWGDPLDRDPERVRTVVREDLISRQAALELYGVVLGDDLSLDQDATKRLRERLRSGRKDNADQRGARP